MKLWLASILLRWGNRLDTPTARAQREALSRYLTARAFQRLNDGFRREIEAEYGPSLASRKLAVDIERARRKIGPSERGRILRSVR